jgi:hypothetical protein
VQLNSDSNKNVLKLNNSALSLNARTWKGQGWSLNSSSNDEVAQDGHQPR